MKKFLIFTLALALLMSLSVPVFATEYDETDTGGQTNLTFTAAPEPTYTVTIPASLTLSIGDNPLAFEVSDSANLGGQEVVITFEKTQFYISGDTFANAQIDGTGVSIYYDLYDMNGTKVSYLDFGSNVIDLNTQLAAFDTDGTENIKLVLHSTVIGGAPIPVGMAFTGFIVFGIALV